MVLRLIAMAVQVLNGVMLFEEWNMSGVFEVVFAEDGYVFCLSCALKKTDAGVMVGERKLYGKRMSRFRSRKDLDRIDWKKEEEKEYRNFFSSLNPYGKECLLDGTVCQDI